MGNGISTTVYGEKREELRFDWNQFWNQEASLVVTGPQVGVDSKVFCWKGQAPGDTLELKEKV